MSVERRLAAILFTDVVGYTALMGRDEAAGRRVRARHEALVRAQVERYHGRWIEEKGDESLSVFPSALEALNCALALQAELEGDPELSLRIGIHLGDVTLEDGRVYGDGVNVAARIRPLAAPGGIAVSGPVYDSIKNQPGISAVSQGEPELKNVATPVTVWFVTGTAGAPEPSSAVAIAARRRLVPVLAAALVSVGLVAVWVGTRTGTSTEASGPIRSLAVLPLDDPAASADDAYFSFSMTEALIAELAKIGELRVISRTSITPYEGSNLPIREIAEQLGVDGIIEGSILRSGNRVRITAQLIDARTDSHIWAETFDRALRDVLPLQAELAREIARRVKVEVLPPTEIGTGSSRPMSAEAYEAYLKANYFVYKRTRPATLLALRYYEEVIRLEPDHPLGYSGLADEYSCAPTHSWSLPDSALWPSVPSEMIARARKNAEKAVELDPLSGPAHNSLALISMYGDWDFETAEAEFRRALELGPGNPWAHYAYHYLLALQLRFDESLVHLEKTLALDPLRPEYGMALAEFYLWTDDPERSFTAWKEAEEIDPSYPGLHQAVIREFCGTERHDESLAALAGANREFPDDPLVLAEMAYCHALAGEDDRARELLTQAESLSEIMYVSPVSRAMVQLSLGEHDLALNSLEQGIRDRDFRVIYLGIDTTWDPLRESPRFIELLERLGLPQA